MDAGRFAANAAWPALVGIAYNLAKWTAEAAGLGRVTTKNPRLTVIAIPARLVRSGRRSQLRLPTGWPSADHITTALEVIGRLHPAPG